MVYLYRGTLVLWYMVREKCSVYHFNCDNVPLEFTYNEYRGYIGTLVHWYIGEKRTLIYLFLNFLNFTFLSENIYIYISGVIFTKLIYLCLSSEILITD